MDKIRITVCLGTACHTMGATDIIEQLQALSRTSLKDIIEVSGRVCAGECYGKAEAAPIVHLNDKTIFEATVDKVLDEVKKLREL